MFLPLLLAVASLVNAPASAANYCVISGSILTDGATIHETIKVVVSSVPRPEMAWKSPIRPWCVEDRRSLGGFAENTITRSPHLGQVKANSYRIGYKGDRLGHDTFAIEHSWLSPSNLRQHGTIIYDVDVVSDPF